MRQQSINKTFLFSWRALIASENGPSNPTTRWVLYCLSTFMNPKKEMVAYPSIEKLSKHTGYCEKAITNNLRIALSEGWVSRRARSINNAAWVYEYTATIPEGKELDSVPVANGTESNSNGTESNSKRSESNSEGTEFNSITNGTKCTQVVTESCLSNTMSSKSSSNKTKKYSIPPNWSPDVQFKNWALNNNIPENFYLSLVDEFIIYWSERGDKRPGWSSTFINLVKRKLEQQNENSKKYSGKYSAFLKATASAFEPD